MWTKPAATEMRFGFEVTMYVMNKQLYKNITYLFITYIVTSKPKRISVAAGLVHMIQSLIYNKQNCLLVIIRQILKTRYRENH